MNSPRTPHGLGKDFAQRLEQLPEQVLGREEPFPQLVFVVLEDHIPGKAQIASRGRLDTHSSKMAERERPNCRGSTEYGVTRAVPENSGETSCRPSIGLVRDPFHDRYGLHVAAAVFDGLGERGNRGCS